MELLFPEITPINLAHEFTRRFDTLSLPTQAGITTLMQKLTIRGFGAKSILEAMNEARVWNDEWFLGPQDRDNRVDRLCWISTDWDSYVGNNMTIAQASAILHEKCQLGWSDGR